MSHRRSPALLLSSAAHWAAVGHPLRLEICELLAATGPLSIVDLARMVRKPADALYHHVKKLQSAGLVAVATTRATGKTSEALFDVVAETFVPDFDPKTGRNVEGFGEMLTASFDTAREFTLRSLRHQSPEQRGNSVFRLDVAHLDEAELVRVKELLAEIRQIVARGRASRTGRLFALTLMLAPIYVAAFARRDELDAPPVGQAPTITRRPRARHRAS